MQDDLLDLVPGCLECSNHLWIVGLLIHFYLSQHQTIGAGPSTDPVDGRLADPFAVSASLHFSIAGIHLAANHLTHRTNGNDQDIDEFVQLGAIDAWIAQVAKVIFDRRQNFVFQGFSSQLE